MASRQRIMGTSMGGAKFGGEWGGSAKKRWWWPAGSTSSVSTVLPANRCGRWPSKEAPTRSCGGRVNWSLCRRSRTLSTTISLNPPFGVFHLKARFCGSSAWTSDPGRWCRSVSDCSQVSGALVAVTSTCLQPHRSRTWPRPHRSPPPLVPAIEHAVSSGKRTAR